MERASTSEPFGTRIKEITWKSRYPEKFRFENQDWEVLGYSRATGSDIITIEVVRKDDEDKITGRFSVDRKIPKNAKREDLLSR